jgi:hypothetical protein
MDDEPPRPRLTIASSTTVVELERDRSLHKVEWATRELAANMIRVIRGAGRPFHLFDQVLSLYRAIEDAPEGTTVGQIHEALEAALSNGIRDDEDSDLHGCVQEIERGALRTVAARLLGQQVQVSAGNRDLWDGFLRLEQRREELRKRRLEEARQTRKALAVKRRKPSTAAAMRKRARELARGGE